MQNRMHRRAEKMGFPEEKHRKNKCFPLDLCVRIVYSLVNPNKPAMESSNSFTARSREPLIVGRRRVRLERMDS